MPDATTTCRRCTECEGQDHHWMSEPQPVNDVDGDDDGLLPVDKHGNVEEEYVWACKHCPATKPYDPEDPDNEAYDDDDLARGPACESCDGMGRVFGADTTDCPDCNGTGLE